MLPIPLRPATAVAVAAAALVALLGPGASADEAGPVPIADAPALSWGFKQSWRQYVGAPQVSDGAAVEAAPSASDPYALTWAFESGSYDASTGETILRYDGTAHWQKYYLPDNPALGNPPPGYPGPLDIHLLDVRLSDPTITIGPDGATISVEATSRQLDTWELLDTGRIDVVNLDVAGVAPVVAGGTTTWTAIPGASTAGSGAVFANNYRAGLAIDAVGFSYSGPGGAPDFSEHWDVPGTTKLSLAENTILTETGAETGYAVAWIDRGRRLVHHESTRQIEGQPFKAYQAFSLDTMSNVGEPLVLPWAERVNQIAFLDTNGGRLFYRRQGETATTRWIAYDADQGKYVQGTLASAIPIVGNANNLSWDAVGQRAFNIRRLVPPGAGTTDYDSHVWQLNLYEEQDDGTWTIESVDLPSFPTGLNRRGYPESGGAPDAPSGIAARDGSLVVLGVNRSSNNPAVPAPATVPGAWRIQLTGGTAAVAAVPGVEIQNSALAAFDVLRPGPDGQLALFRIGESSLGISNLVQRLSVAADGSTVASDPAVDPGNVDPSGPDVFAVDPEDGTAWIGGNDSRRVVGVGADRTVFDRVLAERHPRGGAVIAGLDHAVYVQTNDGSPADVGGSSIYGFGRYERLGWSPEATGDPAPQTVELAAGETAEPAQFHSTGAGDPEPARQWQVKPPGATRFTDLAGETGATLTVDAERGMGGGEYRAVYENAAGRIASDPATLTVAYAPEIAVDVVDATAVEGEPAVFQVLSQGSPEPDVTWERRIGGFWEPIAPDDGDFEIDGGVLTVRETNLDQSGTRIRAQIANSVATVESRQAKLTVEPATTIPPGGLSLDGVSLDWTGSPELQRKAPNMQPNYLSAGASDGGEATYRADAPGVRVLHVAPDGQEVAASWATRAAQTTGAVEQLARLVDGHAEIEQDGSAAVTWDGAFSVNFYGGLVPFTISSPELTVDADGDGTLSADLSGYGASQENPNDRHPIAPVADVTLATFSGVEVDPAGKVTIEPRYAGVEVEPPSGFAPQDRASAGWGAWPQGFVDFHGATGLAPYWYSSGGAFDPHKHADPFTVDFTGAGSVPPPVLPGDDDVFTPPPVVARPSLTSLALSRATFGRQATATVRVATTGATATGGVNVRVAGKVVAATLRDGVARLRLPAGLRPGAHAVRADYAGAAGVAASGASATLRVAKAKPRVSFAVVRRAGGVPSRLAVRAWIPGADDVHPTGQLVVRDRGGIVRVVRLRGSDGGRRAIALPRLRPGAHFLRVALSGGPLQRASASDYRVLMVR